MGKASKKEIDLVCD